MTTNHIIVKKIIGEIYPIGETNTDRQRLQNLKDMCSLVENLLYDISDMKFENKDRYEASVKEAVDYADKFLNKMIKTLSK